MKNTDPTVTHHQDTLQILSSYFRVIFIHTAPGHICALVLNELSGNWLLACLKLQAQHTKSETTRNHHPPESVQNFSFSQNVRAVHGRIQNLTCQCGKANNMSANQHRIASKPRIISTAQPPSLVLRFAQGRPVAHPIWSPCCTLAGVTVIPKIHHFPSKNYRFWMLQPV